MPYVFLLALLLASAPTASDRWGPACCESSEMAEPSAELHALVRSADGRIYAGGTFVAGDSTVAGVAMLAGERWALLGGAFAEDVSALAVGADGALYAARWAAGNPVSERASRPAVVRWTGTAWDAVGDLNLLRQDASALAVGPDGTLYAAVSTPGIGPTQVMRWTGAAWQSLGDSLAGGVSALAVRPDGTVFAAGRFEPPGAQSAESVLQWTGGAWEPVGDGTNGIVRVLAVGADGLLYAGGEFQYAGGPVHDIARWDGEAWTALGEMGFDSGMDYDGVMSLAVGADGTVYAGGRFKRAYGVPVLCIAQWRGGAWQPVGAGWSGPIEAILALPDGTLYVAGFMSSNGARWDGTTWDALPDL